MNITIVKFLGLAMIFSCFSGVFSINAQIVMTFQVDLRSLEMEPGTEVGIRGNLAPLSWDKSQAMEDPEGDSIYTIKVTFNEGKPGDRLMYKYMVGGIWDSDHYGPYGNRVVSLSNCPQVLPVDRWNELNGFALEFLLQDAVESEIYPWIFMISNAKTNGSTAKEVMVKYTRFWGGDVDWLQSPETLMIMERFNQAKYSRGYFEEIENTPNRVVYKMKKNWAEFIEVRGENGKMMDVTGQDMANVSRTWLEIVTKAKGWSFDWEDDGEYAVVTIERK